MNQNSRALIWLCTIACLLAGCSFPFAPSATAALPDPTSIYQTVSAQLTASALAPGARTPLPPTPTSALAATPAPQVELSVTPPTVTAAPPCDQAAAGRPGIDVNVPDGEKFLPGQTFTKTWRLVNAGACSWTREYAVIWFSGETLGKTFSLPFPKVILPGQAVDISVDFTAPQAPGMHQSNWMLRNAEGKLFGLGPTGSAPFWVRIDVLVVRTSTPTSMPTLTVTPTLVVTARGTATLTLEKGLDLDSGKVVSDPSTDLVFEGKTTPELKLVPQNGAVFAMRGAQIPSLADCKALEHKADPIPISDKSLNTYLCYKTNKSLPGFFLVKALDSKDNKLTLEFTTWAVP